MFGQEANLLQKNENSIEIIPFWNEEIASYFLKKLIFLSATLSHLSSTRTSHFTTNYFLDRNNKK